MKILFVLFFSAAFFNPFLNVINDTSTEDTKLLAIEKEIQESIYDIDLVIGAIHIDLGTCNEEGSTFSWTVAVCNNGTHPTRPSTMGMFLFTSTSNITFLEFPTPSISAQSCVTISGTGTHSSGNVSIRAEADSNNSIVETDESNNVTSYTEYCIN